MRQHRSLLLLSGIMLVLACMDRSMTGPEEGQPRSQISDAIHNNGRTHFYFLPPMVSAPATSGVFDSSLNPVVDICPSDGVTCTDSAIATFTMTSGTGSELVRVNAADQLYIVNWHTDAFNISPGQLERIRVKVAARVVAWADVAIIANAGQAKNVTTGEYIPLVDGKTLPIKFRIEQGMPLSITVSPDPLTVIAGKTSSLTATVKDAHDQVLSSQQLAWATNAPSVATVDNMGTVTGVSVGSASVTVSTEAITATAQVDVIPPPVSSVTVAPATATLVTGKTQALTATLKDSDGNVLNGRVVQWSSADEGVARVDANGSVTAKSVGSTNITATSEGKSGASTITVVIPAVATITLGPVSPSVVNGKSLQLTAVLKDADGNVLTDRAITWASSSPNVTVVDGVVSGASIGTATISAAAEGVTSTIDVTVVPPPVYSVEITPSTKTLTEGKSGLFSATLKDIDGNVLTGRSIVWAASNSQVATMNQTGQVDAIAAGQTQITATSEGISGTASLTVVVPPVASVTVTPNPATIIAGQTVQLQATLRDADGKSLSGRSITWSSSGAGATVNQQGLVSGVAPGTYAITATAEGVPGSATLTVQPAGFVLSMIAAGDSHTCGLDATGAAYCWGNNSNGQIGNGVHGGNIPNPTPVTGAHTFVQIVGGSQKTCGRKADGTVFCWGYNGQGDLGDGTFIDRYVPTQMNTSVRFTQISSGGRGGCGLATDGTAWCWGGGDNGLLGAGPVGSQPQPVAVLGGRQYVFISSGINNNCGLTRSGDAYCWGLDYGASPVLVPGGHAFSSVTSGGENFCGLEASGATWCWGTNDAGEFGNGAATGSFHWMPDPVPGAVGLALVSITMSIDHACGRTTAGLVYCWGVNTYGQLGNGTTTSSLVPVQVVGGRAFTEMIGGNRYHNCGLTSDGAIWCWGNNQMGQLGDGTHLNRSSPVRVIVP